MDIIESLHPTAKAWLLNSALAPHLESYCAHFRLGRYAATTSAGCVAGLAHFARWMTQCGLAVEQLDERTVEQFLDEHLPCCDCPRPVRRDHGTLRAALGHMLAVLLEQGVIHAPPAPTGEIADELRRYDDHMNKSRGLSEGTRQSALSTVRQLLLYAFAGRPVVIAELKPDDVRKFIAARLDQVGTTSNAIMLASALRAYFRYRATCGDQVYGLIGVISSPAHWNLASLPQALKPDEVARLLASFNASLPSQKRGYAIVRCALDLGLRRGEIAKLQLTDIDWRNGTVTIKRTKALRQDTLPLPAVTGQALADYVRFERPKTTNQAVFVRVLAPHDQPIGPDAIHRVIRDAFRRIGLKHGRTHALRHTLACQLVNQGSSLKEVADVLRHRHLNTSMIYAKLDNSKLVAVALPWPGSAA
ncbi:site-specific integrase [Rhodoferax sp.]|uniref:site-specific integrase n=1 Tax=Rhodoferax sp. TaxID=50421 RepID=UPI0025D6B14C|nr:site-specific integrase [Rhodoferax sp.]MCM2340310.1 site-specific integrase [Rhodoferax sp.]